MIETIIDYFRQLAEQNVLIRHTPQRVRFISLGVQEAVEKMRSVIDINHLFLLCVYLERRTEARNMDVFIQHYYFDLYFMRNCRQGDFADRFKAYEEADEVSNQFISRMKYDMMHDRLCQVDFSNIVLLPIEVPQYENVWGQKLEISFVKETDYSYNANDWI